VTHTFLVDEGRWLLQGTWLEPNGVFLPIQGKTLVGWGRDDWFTIVTKMNFPDADRAEITFQYRGRLSTGANQYTFVLQHSELGRVEGEGWIGPESIIQRYWVLGDRRRRGGFETLHWVDKNTYHLSSGIMSGHHLISTMEATLARQANE
jgi:hypothetical protein